MVLPEEARQDTARRAGGRLVEARRDTGRRPGQAVTVLRLVASVLPLAALVRPVGRPE
jgi:hypothetical protein